MQLSQLLLEAFNLMLIGMLSVGLFLGVLVFLIPLLNRITPDDILEPATSTNSPSNHIEQNELIAVISIAVQKYRSKHK